MEMPNGRNEARCPGFLIEPLKEAHQICTHARGVRTWRATAAISADAPEALELTHLDVQGHRVEFAASIHGLYGLTGAIDVLIEPTKGAAAAGHAAPTP